MLSRDPGLFTISVDPLAGKEIADVEKAIDEELERLKKEPISGEELEKAKNQVEAEFVYGQDSLFYQAMLLGQFEITQGWRKIDEYISSVRKVTGEDIARVTKRYLTPENRTVGILVPLPPEEGKPIRPEPRSLDHLTR
jgi:zinc protease